jgi:hypothetical protein
MRLVGMMLVPPGMLGFWAKLLVLLTPPSASNHWKMRRRASAVGTVPSMSGPR